jgi:DnaA family protein
MKGSQLALPVALSDPQDFAHFHPGPNVAAISTLRALLEPEPGSALLLHGPVGSGKSHLVQALLSEAVEYGVPAARLEAVALTQLPRGLEQKTLLCLDGVDTLTLDDAATLALIRLLDARRSRAVATLITARRPASQLELPRPDLVTRLAGMTSFGLRPLTNDDRIELLRLRAASRGLHLNPEVALYLLKHLPRDLPSLLAAVDALDTASLAAQRRLTVPFVQQSLGLGS